MPMRVDCKNYESRTYPNGDTARMCRLNLAPDAPWRCPEDCPSFSLKLGDGGWTVGSLQTLPTPDEPASVADGSAAAVLKSAKEVVNAVGNQVAAEVRGERESAVGNPNTPWWKFWQK